MMAESNIDQTIIVLSVLAFSDSSIHSLMIRITSESQKYREFVHKRRPAAGGEHTGEQQGVSALGGGANRR